jgi:hypothetical protein
MSPTACMMTQQARDEASLQSVLRQISTGQAATAARNAGLAASQLFVILLSDNITLHRYVP